jgi:hypothetical protein
MLWDKLYSTYRLYTVFRLSYDVLWQVVKHSCDYMSHDPHQWDMCLFFSLGSSCSPHLAQVYNRFIDKHLYLSPTSTTKKKEKHPFKDSNFCTHEPIPGMVQRGDGSCTRAWRCGACNCCCTWTRVDAGMGVPCGAVCLLVCLCARLLSATCLALSIFWHWRMLLKIERKLLRHTRHARTNVHTLTNTHTYHLARVTGAKKHTCLI